MTGTIGTWDKLLIISFINVKILLLYVFAGEDGRGGSRFSERLKRSGWVL